MTHWSSQQFYNNQKGSYSQIYRKVLAVNRTWRRISKFLWIRIFTTFLECVNSQVLLANFVVVFGEQLKRSEICKQGFDILIGQEFPMKIMLSFASTKYMPGFSLISLSIFITGKLNKSMCSYNQGQSSSQKV